MKTDFRILIVDDIPHNIEIIKTILEDTYILEAAITGEEALEKLPLFRPDLILLDVKLPGLSGFEVCEEIRAQEEYNYVKIMIVSALTMVDDRLQGYEVGADDYITKPFVAEELEAKIKVFLNLKRTKEIDKLKTDLLALFSHETRTPLNTIIGMSSLLMDEEHIDEETKSTISMINDSGRQLQKFVEKTSFLCTLKSVPKVEKHEEPLIHHIDNVILSLDKQIQKKNLTVTHHVAPETSLIADWEMLYEVFEYLLHNAIKFSPDNGEITITERSEDGYYLLTISDQGKGIPAEWMDKIFDEFAIQDIMHHQKGQGLSLAIARHVLNLHNGQITASNNETGGASFEIRLPL